MNKIAITVAARRGFRSGLVADHARLLMAFIEAIALIICVDFYGVYIFILPVCLSN